MQEEDLVSLEKEPNAHKVQLELFEVELYFPGTQSKQAVAPFSDTNDPGSQAKQMELASAGEKDPAEQYLQLEEPAFENVPAVQFIHTELFAELEYVPP